MKKKLRKIIIGGFEYLYYVVGKYHTGTGTNTLTVKIFLNGKKVTPLVINFLTLDDYYMGQILKTGILLFNKFTNTKDEVNLNEPKYIRKLIIQGQKDGWTGINKIESKDGLEYLRELGYEVDFLKPPEVNNT